ncbi:nitrogenase component I subunit alpha [Clostridium cibarium]|uniref:Nitrogenase protein alpha chain n=1 Tax=Clostridium cibarium TaxID=2762247 RepID=A0ABR8PQ55_9CLOT|nr:nitrogenase component I subunit alpha [Clostridium cibarium]MBD7910308.1 nitrogenase component I subunit alpha [Clostridium cibarium]
MSKVDSVLENYSAKVYKNRKKHMLELVEDKQEIGANSRTMPGMLTHRGCCYAGCKGVVLGPIKDAAIITHGPIGCGYYSWGTRRNKAIAKEDGKNFLEYCFSTDLQESDIVFGGEKKLKQAIKEVVEIFNPKTIFICATCPVGLIGDDLPAVAAEAKKMYGIEVVSFACEGYKGVSQSAGHHIANNSIIKNLIGTSDYEPKKHSVNILGEYNIGGDGFEIGRILKSIGYEVISIMTGDGSVDDIRKAHTADLNLVQCHRSINYIAEMMNIQYGTSWMKVNFIGVDSTIQTLRDMAKFFDDPVLTARTEEVIEEELENIKDDIAVYREKLTGKKAALFVGGSRSHHYQMLLKDFGVETVLAAYEFAHRDDYEGREVIPTIIEDADLKNIEVLEVEKIEDKFKIVKSQEDIEELKTQLKDLEDYPGMMRDMNKGSVVVDDLNHYETEEFIKKLKPDVFFSGIKDKFVIQKGGVLSRQLHSYDYSGPYAGFRGAVNFGRDLTMGLYTPAWGFTCPPWKKEPILEGTFGGEE